MRKIEYDSDIEIWRDRPSRREYNNGYGLCNTDSEFDTVCLLGGVYCNVDHRWIKLMTTIEEKCSK
jgi:hypothetical protein